MFDESLCPPGKRWALKVVRRLLAGEVVENAVWKIAAHCLETVFPGAFAAVSREVERQNDDWAAARAQRRQRPAAPQMEAPARPVPVPRRPSGNQWWSDADG